MKWSRRRTCYCRRQFPCESIGKNAIVIRADGHSTTDILDAVLSLIPLDTYTEKPVALMEVVKGDNTPTPAIWLNMTSF